MEQLLPEPKLLDYMWQYLASLLLGTIDNQTFNIFTGSGRNGKSCLIDLLGKTLGEYKQQVPMTLISNKRPSIGGTSSEIALLKGCRFAVIQEPQKDDRFNEGILKEITGGDPIQGRALYKDTITFIPQFKLAVTTNVLPDINSQDDGTWRRIRVCDFMSKFLPNPYEDPKFPSQEFPFQFKLDKKLPEKFKLWAPVLLSILVDLAYKFQGNVKDCDMVMKSSDCYREGQDYLSEFIKDKICKCQNSKIQKTDLMCVFKEWYQNNIGRKLPKAKELYDFMDHKYGKYRNGSWKNIKIIYDEADIDSEDDEENTLHF